MQHQSSLALRQTKQSSVAIRTLPATHHPVFNMATPAMNPAAAYDEKDNVNEVEDPVSDPCHIVL